MSRYLRSFVRLPVLLIVIAVTIPDLSAQWVISEFRVRGPAGANDEFIEVMNNSDADRTVASASGTGLGVAASDGLLRCSIPNGTVVPGRGHYLCVNSTAFSLASYPAGNGTTATGDATYTTDIPDNAGIALFNTNLPGSFLLANRLDAVGSTSEANTLYKEGTGYPALTPFSIDYSFVRDVCGKGGSITTFAPCPRAGLAIDTNNNAADFIFVDSNGTSAGAGQRLGAAGPENLSAPLFRGSSISTALLDTCSSLLTPPNYVRDFTSDPPNNSTFGTVDIRRTFTNNTGGNVTRLRYRIMDLTTFPAPSDIADLRPRTSTAVVVTVDRPPCGVGTSNVTVNGTTLEQPPSQPNGGGWNSTLSSGTVTLGTPLANGASVNVRFLLGVQQPGAFKLGLIIEALPAGGSLMEVSGHTNCGFTPAGGSALFTVAGGDASVNVTETGVCAWTAASNASWITITGGTGASGTGNRTVTYNVAPALSTLARSGVIVFGGVQYAINQDGYIAARGDFNGDGKTDILIRNSSTGAIGMWIMNGASIVTGALVGTPGISYTVAGVGDFNGDGYSDILLRDTLGNLGMWIMSGTTVAIGAYVGSPGAYTVAGVGDFNGDGKADILLRDGLGSIGMWLMNGSAIAAGGFVGSAAGYSVSATGDFNGDGKADILLRDTAGTLGMWLMNGSTIASGGSLGSVGTSVVGGAADYDFDGRADIVLRDSVGNIGIWFMNGLTVTSGSLVGTVSGFQIAGVGNHNGDFYSDILLRNSSTGDVGLWSMTGASISGGGLISSLSLSFEVR